MARRDDKYRRKWLSGWEPRTLLPSLNFRPCPGTLYHQLVARWCLFYSLGDGVFVSSDVLSVQPPCRRCSHPQGPEARPLRFMASGRPGFRWAHSTLNGTWPFWSCPLNKWCCYLGSLTHRLKEHWRENLSQRKGFGEDAQLPEK